MKKEQKKKTVKGNVWKAHCLSASFGFCKGGRERSTWTWHVLNHRATTVAKKKLIKMHRNHRFVRSCQPCVLPPHKRQ
jgi:hypothetical protein